MGNCILCWTQAIAPLVGGPLLPPPPPPGLGRKATAEATMKSTKPLDLVRKLVIERFREEKTYLGFRGGSLGVVRCVTAVIASWLR